ncbi:MAG: hypothetical protein JJT94_09710 [Bernardetiaceae bacterium]|nr:hypothetical protein [Bernardetiaceae bacterium]
MCLYFRYCLLFVIVMALGFQHLYAQGGSAQGFYVDSTSRYYQRADLPVYLRISTSPEGEGIPLSGAKKSDNEVAVEPMYLDGHGKHILRHSDATDPQNTYEYVIFADGLPPQSRSSFDSPYTYRKGNTQYYGKDLRITVQTQDQMVGVEDLFVRLDTNPYASYSNTISVDSEGEHQLQYYAIDKVGNKEGEVSKSFIVDITAPESIYNVIGITEAGVISTSTKIYLEATDNIVGVAQTYYRFDEQRWKPYVANSILPVANLDDGDHRLEFYSIDHLKNQEEIKSFEFYLDKTAPIMSADVLGDKFIVGDQVYFSGRTKLKLTAVDNKSGVKQVWYSIDNGEYQKYDQPFYLPNKAGLHTIRYFAEDNVGNEGVEGMTKARYDEYKHNVSAVYVDLTGPKLDYSYQGKTFRKGDKIYISGETKIKLTAIDTESGVQKVSYKKAGEGEELTYSAPFTVKESGLQQLEIIGYDNVNNRNLITTEFVVDAEPPAIYHYFSVSAIKDDLYPSYAKIYLAAQDAQTDCDEIYYRINGGKLQRYNGAIGGFKKNATYTIQLEAIDELGNKATKEVIFNTDTY